MGSPPMGTVCHRWVRLATIKSEIFMFTHYEDMKGNKKYRNWGGLRVSGH